MQRAAGRPVSRDKIPQQHLKSELLYVVCLPFSTSAWMMYLWATNWTEKQIFIHPFYLLPFPCRTATFKSGSLSKASRSSSRRLAVSWFTALRTSGRFIPTVTTDPLRTVTTVCPAANDRGWSRCTDRNQHGPQHLERGPLRDIKLKPHNRRDGDGM